MADDEQDPVPLKAKTVGDDWVVPVYVDEASELDMGDWVIEETRAQLRTTDGTLLASSNPDDITEDNGVALIVLDGDESRNVPATDLDAGQLIMLLIDSDTVGFPTGNPVHLQVSTSAPSLMGRQTIGTFTWLVRKQIEVNP